MSLKLGIATEKDAKSLCADVRQKDDEEWIAGGEGQSTLKSLLFNISHSDIDSLCWAVTDEDGCCLAIWGVKSWPHDPHVGIAWMICANGALTRLNDMHRFFKIGIERMHQEYPILHAWALSTNYVHHKWMLKFGFRDSGMSVPGAFNTRFMKFTRTETAKVHVLSRGGIGRHTRALSR